jgi:hypothetical protein
MGMTEGRETTPLAYSGTVSPWFNRFYSFCEAFNFGVWPWTHINQRTSCDGQEMNFLYFLYCI